MPRALFDSEYLYGFHDPGGEHIMVGRGIPGWVLFTRALGHDPNNSAGDDFSQYSNQGLGVMVRLNNGYGGTGTLPKQAHYDDFARRCANYVANTAGARIWILGNETNHPIEWPGADWDWSANPPRPRSEATRGEPITPDAYARCYRKVRDAIHALPGHADDQILIGAVAPWNPLTTYPGNEQGDWVLYFRHILEQLGPGQCDGVTLHAYTHGTAPDLIRSERMVGEPRFSQYHWDFRTYRDFMQAIPANMRHLPVYITEADQGDDPWRDENSGWVQAAYGEIDDWNQNNTQKIRSLILYRWPRHDRWYIEGKSGVIEDFRQALAFEYKWTDGEGAGEDRLAELWRRLQSLEAQFSALKPEIDRAGVLSETLADENEQLDALAPQLEDVATVQEQLQALASEVSDLEGELEQLTPIPIVPPGAAPKPTILDVMADLPQHESARWAIRDLSDIKRIVVHHTVTRTDVTPRRIAEIQVGRGKPGIAYHFLIDGDGVIYATQPLSRIVLQNSASAINASINADSIAVALAGDFRASRHVEPSESQRTAAAQLIAWLMDNRKLGTVIEQIVFGRNELGEPVGSPGDQWLNGVRYKDKLIADIKRILDEAAACADSEELAELRLQAAALQAEVARLEAIAAQVGPLQEEIGSLQITVGRQATEIDLLRDIANRCTAAVGRPEVVDMVDSLVRHPQLAPYKQRTKPITKLVIHHTDTPKNFTVERIAEYHVFGTSPYKQQWPGIGYHYVIAADGTIYWCQRHETHSYHAGMANGYSVGVSLIGRFLRTGYDNQPQAPEDRLPTPAQMESVSRLAAWLLQEFKISDIQNVVGHKEVGVTACPGDQWMRGERWKDALHERIQAARASKPVPFYLLFWDHGYLWASSDWENAQDYIAHFRPTSGFSLEDALQARRVLIVGGPAGVSGEDEAKLRAAGVEVYRLAGENEAATRAMLDELVVNNTPWPGAEPVGLRDLLAQALPPEPEPEPDAWTIPDDFLAPPPMEDAPSPEKVRVETTLMPPPID